MVKRHCRIVDPIAFSALGLAAGRKSARRAARARSSSAAGIVARENRTMDRIVSASVPILAVDELRLLRMQHEPARSKACVDGLPQRPRFLFAAAMTDDVVRVAFERDAGMVPRHPDVERVVQEQIRQQGADNAALWRSRRARHDAAILQLHRRLQPTLDVEQLPRTVRVFTHGLEQQAPIDRVEEALDVDVEHPVAAPAPLARLTDCVDCRSAWTISIGIRHGKSVQARAPSAVSRLLVQRGLRPWEFPTVARRRRPSESSPVAPVVDGSCLRTSDSRACRGCLQDQPQTLRSSVRLLQPLPGWPSPFEGVPDFPLRDVERLCLVHRAPPVTGWPVVAAEQRGPFGPVPLQSLPPYYEPLRPCAPHRYSGPRGFSRLDVSLCIGTTGSHVPYKSLIRASRRLHAGRRSGSLQVSPELVPEEWAPPGFDVV